MRSRSASRSHGQYHLGQQLKALYRTSVILEEFGIPDSRLSLDFFIPNRRLAFEFQGVQHDEYNLFFHNSEADFNRQRQRDQEKRDWCAKNRIVLVEIRDKRIARDSLKDLIKEAIDEQRCG